MTNKEAQKIAEEMRKELHDYYLFQREQLDKAITDGSATITLWIEEKEYRQKNNLVPAVNLRQVIYAYHFGLSDWRERNSGAPQKA